MEDWKIKIAVLWLIYDVAGLAAVALMFMEPGVLAELVEEGTIEGLQMGPEMLLVGAVLLLVPLVMAFLSLILKDSSNRWANIIAGIVFIGLGVTDLPTYVAKPSAYAILMWLSTIVATVLIVWYAWKSKPKA